MHTRIKLFVSVAAAAALLFILAACGTAAPTNTPTATAVPERTGAVVRITQDPKWGPILTDETGRTLYLYQKDAPRDLACKGTCFNTWPPMVSDGRPVAESGLNGADLNTVERFNGMQVTYKGSPLYYYSGDHTSGQDNGQGVGGVWWVVNPAGQPVTQAQ